MHFNEEFGGLAMLFFSLEIDSTLKKTLYIKYINLYHIIINTTHKHRHILLCRDTASKQEKTNSPVLLFRGSYGDFVASKINTNKLTDQCNIRPAIRVT